MHPRAASLSTAFLSSRAAKYRFLCRFLCNSTSNSSFSHLERALSAVLDASMSRAILLDCWCPSACNRSLLMVARWKNLIPLDQGGLRPHALQPGAIQGKEGIKFCHLATPPPRTTTRGRRPPTTSTLTRTSPRRRRTTTRWPPGTTLTCKNVTRLNFYTVNFQVVPLGLVDFHIKVLCFSICSLYYLLTQLLL